MSTARGIKKQRADHKESTAATRPSSVAQLLPVNVLLHFMRLLDDARSLARFQSVCRNWSTFANYQLDLCWRPLYLRDWEAESSTDECILTSGETTAWKQRYRERARVEMNWRTGTGRVVLHCPLLRNTRTRDFAHSTWCVLYKSSRIITSLGLDICVFDMTGRELYRWQPHSSKADHLKIHQTLLATGHHDGVIKISDIEGRSVLQTLTGHTDSVDHLHFSDSVFVSGCSLDDSVRIWDMSTGECKHIIDGPGHPCSEIAVNWTVGLVLTVDFERPEIRLHDLYTGSQICARAIPTQSDHPGHDALWTSGFAFDQATGRAFVGVDHNELSEILYSNREIELCKVPRAIRSWQNLITLRRHVMLYRNDDHHVNAYNLIDWSSTTVVGSPVLGPFSTSFRLLLYISKEGLFVRDFAPVCM